MKKQTEKTTEETKFPKTRAIERLLTVQNQALKSGDLVLAALARSERLTVLDTVRVD